MKMVKFFSFIHLMFCCTTIWSQIKIGSTPTTIQSSSIFEIESTTKGVLLPRLNNTQVNTLLSQAKVNNANGLIVYNVESKNLQIFDATSTTGNWYNIITDKNGVGSSGWSLSGNSATNSTNNFIGTTDVTDFSIATNNTKRITVTTDGATDFKNNKIKSFSANLITINTNNYTLSDAENGSVLLFTSTTDISVNVPNTLPVGYNVIIHQIGAGVITLIPMTGVNLNNRLNLNKTAGQFAMISLIKYDVGNCIISGDLK
jgi:hypothetical protein